MRMFHSIVLEWPGWAWLCRRPTGLKSTASPIKTCATGVATTLYAWNHNKGQLVFIPCQLSWPYLCRNMCAVVTKLEMLSALPSCRRCRQVP